MSAEIINISELFSSQSLVTRQAARDLFAHISHMQEKSIILNLSKISFASRSFFDEFNSYENEFILLGKNITIINLNDDLTQLFQMVKQNSGSIISISYDSVANAKVIFL